MILTAADLLAPSPPASLTASADRGGLSFVDLFAGAGGMSCGLMAAGLTHLGGVEVDPFAAASYQTNTGKAIELDLEREDAAAQIVEKVGGWPDLVVGGPPCQGFSMAGKRDPNDPRSSLVYRFVEVATALNPQIILMENVPGIRSMKLGGQIVPDALQEMLEVRGYQSKTAILTASHYGAATIRRRFFLLGWREGLTPQLPAPFPGEPTGVGWALWGLEGGTRHGPLPEPPEGFPNAHLPTRHKAETLTRMRGQKWGEPLYPSWSHSWVRLHPDHPAPTMKENHGAVAVHPLRDRVVTPREMARVQGFPDEWIFCGKKSDILVQVGNAVPPPLACAIGLSLLASTKTTD